MVRGVGTYLRCGTWGLGRESLSAVVRGGGEGDSGAHGLAMRV